MDFQMPLTEREARKKVERRQGPAQAAPRQRKNIGQRAIKAAAESMSRRNLASANAELLNETIIRLTILCYEVDDTGNYCNVDFRTGRILIPMPTSRIGRPKWQLYRSEGDTLRKILYHWQNNAEPAPLYQYDNRSWYINLIDYPTIEHAKQYLGRDPISPQLWREIRDSA